MIVESHAHYSHRKFDQTFSFIRRDNGEYTVSQINRDDFLRNLISDRISYFLEPAIDMDSNKAILSLCRKYSGRFFAAVGVHPTRTWHPKWSDRKKLNEYIKDKNVVAVGETGLDYHYKRSDQHRYKQFIWFVYQLRLAHKYKLPLILHIRRADKHAIRILRLFKAKLHGGVVHCFWGDSKTAQQYLNLGLYIGIGGAILQDNKH